MMSSFDEQSHFSSSVDDSSAKDSSRDTSTHSFVTGTSQEDEARHIKDQLAKQETKAVFRLRVLVILLLIAAATCISVTVYYLTRSAEFEEFETQYYGVADKIIQSFQDIMVEISAVSGLAVTASGQSIGQKEQWPFITMPNFQERAGNARTLSGAIYLSINPVVPASLLPAWESYARGPDNSWIEQGLDFQDQKGINITVDQESVDRTWLTHYKVDPLHTVDENGYPTLSRSSEGTFLPRWQSSPVLPFSMVNENIFEHPEAGPISKDCVATKAAVLGGFSKIPEGGVSHPHHDTSVFAALLSFQEGENIEYSGDPISHMAMPIFHTLDGTERDVVAVLLSTIHWRSYLKGILPSTVHGISVVIENTCDGFYTYEMSGLEAYPVGFGDQHDPTFDKYQVDGRFLTETIEDGTITGIRLNQEGCPYSFHVYPTQEFKDDFITRDPIVISLTVASVFFFTIIMFILYDRFVERRQTLVVAKATQSAAIVYSLFPKQVRDRLMDTNTEKKNPTSSTAPEQRNKSFLSGSGPQNIASKQIADLFPHCTVCFADISGFTAWSSTREPTQVFILLQSIYQAFDIIAKRRRVFKVETIGDSYVAVAGLPEPQAQHAEIMSKFAWDCLLRISEVTKELEVQLGPDTGDLSMRFGLHSGPVTAGVLKGDRARFQLFGDTVNTASRMESTGERGKIQISQATADILMEAGKSNWLTPREDGVEAKGKGRLATYWMSLHKTVRTASIASSEDGILDDRRLLIANEGHIKFNPKQDRLINWMVDILLSAIKKIVIVRESTGKCTMSNENFYYEAPEGTICMDEVKSTIAMPMFDAAATKAAKDFEAVEVPYDIVEQLRDYVTLIANSYQENPFHSFDHACHVTMSVSKLLHRVVAPDTFVLSPEKTEPSDVVEAQIHEWTYGISTDPMVVFSLLVSALIHDVDHQGISNVQLAKEEPEMGETYRNKSLAEQNSLDVAWDEFMSDRFQTLRKYIFGSREEMMRFRQLIVNLVLATDIFDADNRECRKKRWEEAFHGDGSLPTYATSDLRATIVMEHIIQASDVAHTMQHWHVYQKWNERLFKEMYSAFKSGRMAADPREFWFEGELKFFDNYIIPLAKKLKECKVFGVCSDEYLSYAELNRDEWQLKGQDILEKMIKKVDASQESA